MTGSPRIHFDFSVDEAVAFHLSLLKTSPEASSWRRREQWKFAGAFTFPVVVVPFLLARGELSLSVAAAAIAGALVVGLLLAVLFGWYHDLLLKRRARRLLVEQLGGEGPHLCSVELRPEGLWVGQRDHELLFPWQAAISIHDVPEGVEVRFKGGGVLARSRGFASPDDRRDFLRRLCELVPPNVASHFGPA